MPLKEIHKLISVKGLLKIVLLIAVVLQLIIVSQLYFFNADLFRDPLLLLARLFRGVSLSFLAGLLLAYPSIILISILNKKYPWKKNAILRFLFQCTFALSGGLIITPIILIPAIWVFGIERTTQTIISNAYYLAVLSLFLMIVLEAWVYFNYHIEAKIKAVELQKKLIQESAEKLLMEEGIKMEAERTRLTQELMEEERSLNQVLNQEIKKREEIARELKESKEQLHSLLSHLTGAVYRCQFDEYFTMQYISNQILEITGYEASDFIDNAVRSYASVVYSDDWESLHQAIEKSLKANEPFEMEYRLTHQNGKTVWVKESGKAVLGSGGDVAFLTGIIVDVTRRKEAELAAKESERNYKELMDFLPQPVFELNLQGQIILSNKAGDDFFGALPQDPLNRPSALDFFLPEEREQIIEKWRISSQGLSTEPGEFTAIKQDGSHCPVLIFGNPIYRHGEITGRRGIIIDISERKKYELGLLKAKEELEKINNNLENLVAERSHELLEINNQLFKVQKENLQSQFEILRQQINPHFLFNSLNVLSGLISKDVFKAQIFIDEFSHIYRYVLETLEQPVSSLNRELDFMRSYLFLQQMRHGENLTWTVNVAAELLEYVMPPLSLQVVLENALKHNIVNEAKPLEIEIFSKDTVLIVRNRLQPKISKGVSTGLGLKNLIKRYGLISKLCPAFTIENNYYVAILPLINTENDESTDR